MKNPDEMVDRVLAALREVETPIGMERRVLAAMEERAAVRVGFRPTRWVVACAVVAVGIAGVMLMRPARVPASNNVAVAPAVQPVRVERVQERNARVLHYVRGDVTLRKAAGIRRQNISLAGPMEPGGFPAPPMPLTESEKLLLRVAHRADATELTPLNAEARARQSAEFDAGFMEFFAPPDVPEDETSSPENAKGETR